MSRAFITHGSRLRALTAVQLAVAACARSPADERAAHPDERYHRRAPVPYSHVELPAPQIELAGAIGLAGARRSRGRWSDLDDRGTPIERAAAVAIGSAGNILIADDRLRRATVFGPYGRRLQALTIGPPGSNPASDPISATSDAEGQFYVGLLDHTVHVFGKVGGTFVRQRTIDIDVAPRSMCVLGKRLFVSGAAFEDSLTIRVYDVADGRRVGSFAELYASSNQMVNYQLRRGRMLCDDALQLVILAAGSPLAEVRAYRPSGEVMWATEFSGFIPIRMVGIGKNGYRVEVPASGYHRLVGLARLGAESLLVQYAFAQGSLQERERLTYVATVLLNARTGAAMSKSGRYPAVAGAGRGVTVVWGGAGGKKQRLAAGNARWP